MDVQKVPQGMGSGFFWDDKGHIVTNYHVIKGAADIKVALIDQSVWSAKVSPIDLGYFVQQYTAAHNRVHSSMPSLTRCTMDASSASPTCSQVAALNCIWGALHLLHAAKQSINSLQPHFSHLHLQHVTEQLTILQLPASSHSVPCSW